tara:strand:+ start:257 stop:754 length:498 start_codon:yes stop_codon:yes gene_type:complete
MIFNKINHKIELYNTLLELSRNVFFYKKLKLKDNFETRIYLMFIHFSIMMIIFKKKGEKFDQKSYDSLFFNIENNLRELGFGDVSVNKKMKDLNKLLYDILLKIEVHNDLKFKINKKLIIKYFKELDNEKNDKFNDFESYFVNFYNFCFELPLKNMIREAIKFKY